MSLNGWGGRLWEPLAAYLADAQPDVLCLQEVVHTPSAPAPWLTYRDGTHVLPQRAEMFAEVSALLPDHTATFCPAAQGELWEGDRTVPSQWGLATFVRKTIPVIGQAQGFVHKSWSPQGYGDHPRSRSAHVVRLWDERRERAVTVGHMHGLRDPIAGKRDTADRAAQAHSFVRLIEQVAEPADGLVVCGDFNVEPSSETLAILRALGLTELVTARGAPGTRTSHYAKPGKFADYMMVGGAEAKRFEVVRAPEVSDHCALVVEI